MVHSAPIAIWADPYRPAADPITFGFTPTALVKAIGLARPTPTVKTNIGPRMSGTLSAPFSTMPSKAKAARTAAPLAQASSRSIATRATRRLARTLPSETPATSSAR